MSVQTRLTKWKDMKVSILLVILVSVIYMTNSSPMRFMCDMCEVDWVSCLINCPLEQFLNRKKFDRWGSWPATGWDNLVEYCFKLVRIYSLQNYLLSFPATPCMLESPGQRLRNPRWRKCWKTCWCSKLVMTALTVSMIITIFRINMWGLNPLLTVFSICLLMYQ